jgi:predicted Rossmann fold nucleotide-binding protein DprA/Smf involved in DNA uptake
MKIAVIGSRDFNDYDFLSESLKFLSSNDTIISGGARGADSLAERYAKENQINFVVFPGMKNREEQNIPLI